MDDVIEVKPAHGKKGKGAFAKKDIPKGKIIEISHVILIPNLEYENIKKTVLDNYTFIWDDPKNEGAFHMAFALTICQFMNHSYDPNVIYQFVYRNETIEFMTLRNIKKGEELTINYNGYADDNSPMWFDVE